MGDFPGVAHVYRPAGRKEPIAHHLWEIVNRSSALNSRLLFPSAPLVIGVASEPGCHEQQNTDSYRVVEMYMPTPDGIVGEVVPVAIIATATNDPDNPTATSRLAVDLLYAALRRVSDQPIQQRLVEALQQAQQSNAQPTAQPTNTPISIAVGAVWRNTFYLTYIGECRAYLLRNGALQQLTTAPRVTTIYLPPIFPPRQRRPALLTAPKRQSQDPFTTAAAALPPAMPMESSPSDLVLQHTNQIELRKGDTLLLCTPGLYRVVSEEAIRNAVVQQQPQAAAWQLAIQANQARATDSYTILILQPADGQAPAARSGSRKHTMPRGLLVLACLLLVIIQLFVFAQLGNAPSLADHKPLPMALVPPLQQSAPFASEEAEAPDPFVAPNAQPPVGSDPLAMRPLQTQAAVADGEAPTRPQAALPAALIVQRLWTRLALTTTLMSFSQNVPILLERAGNAVAAAHTATASAPLPTPTPTLTPMPTPTRPRQVRASSPTPARTPAAQTVRPDFTNATVKLLEPAENDSLTDKRPFRWQANFVLPPGYAFELVFWQEGQDPLKHGKGYAGLTTLEQINAGYEHLRIRNGWEGEYRWGVLLVTKEPYQRIKYLGGARVIYIKQK